MFELGYWFYRAGFCTTGMLPKRLEYRAIHASATRTTRASPAHGMVCARIKRLSYPSTFVIHPKPLNGDSNNGDPK